MWPLINDVETGATPEYPDLQPQRLSLPAATALEECEAVVCALKRWFVEHVDVPGGVVEATRKTRVGFVDDLTIRVTPDGDDACVVSVRSRSRVGRWDLGQNARSIRNFQAALQEAVVSRLSRREAGA